MMFFKHFFLFWQIKKHSEIKEQIKNLEKLISKQTAKNIEEDNSADALDVFMSKLQASDLNEIEKKNVKLQLNNLHRQENIILDSIRKLCNNKKICL